MDFPEDVLLRICHYLDLNDVFNKVVDLFKSPSEKIHE